MRFELLHTHPLPDFPSASSINVDDGEFYIVGDDANKILVLDNNYNSINHLAIFNYPGKRISKPQKADLESSVLINIRGELHLIAFGSASIANRKKIILLPIKTSKDVRIIDNHAFADRLTEKGIKEVNIEGATMVGDVLLLANRGNNSYKENHIIVTTKDFWTHQTEAPLVVSQLIIPPISDVFIGVSEIHYVPAEDILLFTLTSEATANSYDDGTIGDSYIGWIHSVSNRSMNILDGVTNLSEIYAEFKGQKIEGICAEPSGENDLILHLAADNDSGESKIFKVRMYID